MSTRPPAASGRLNRYVDGARACFANVTLAGGRPVLISVARGKGIRVHRLWAFGRLPGRTVWAADWPRSVNAAKVLAAGIDAYPPLDFPDVNTEMNALLDEAIQSITALAEGRTPLRPSPLEILTRVALGTDTPEALGHTLERASNTPPPPKDAE